MKLGGEDQEGEAPTVRVRVKPETFFKLKKIARVRKITVSQVVRHLLEGRDVDTVG